MVESARELEQNFQARAREFEQSIKPVADEVQSAANELKTAVAASAAEVHNTVAEAPRVEPVAQAEVLPALQIPPVVQAAVEAAEAPSEPAENDAQLDLFASSEPVSRKN
jgi:hypothetical protein